MKQEPGWYADPFDGTKERYWDGSRWATDPAPRPRSETTTSFDAPPPRWSPTGNAEDDETQYRATMIGLAEAQLAAQERTATYLAILTYIVVIATVLGIAAGVLTFVAAR